jgi:adenylate kinase family enzyme
VRRILVIGSGGSGKSTFARRLGARLRIEVLHLDKAYWRPGWVETPKDEWRRKVGELACGEAWVIDGNYGGTLDLRLAACDTVIFLDLPRTVCLWRVIKRRLMYRQSSRPDMAEGCRERFDLKFLYWVWSYSSSRRPKILALLDEHSRDKRIVRLRSRAEVERFLDGLSLEV